MLLFIKMRIKIPTTEYISIHLMLLFIDVNEILFGPYVLFQYISCYCLSMIGLAKGDDHPVFQYISCYCLSASTASASTISSNFTTSHVTVYQWYYDSRLFTVIDFNTSHVTVYPELIQKWTMLKCISIHLMLLFIGLFNLATKGCDSFQYISCYCLSYTNHCFRLVHIHFNTSHVTVYLSDCCCTTQRSIFQYISCYCLSVGFRKEWGGSINFNTSHVTVYPSRFGDRWGFFYISIHLMLLFIEQELLEMVRL